MCLRSGKNRKKAPSHWSEGAKRWICYLTNRRFNNLQVFLIYFHRYRKTIYLKLWFTDVPRLPPSAAYYINLTVELEPAPNYSAKNVN